jgi:rhodanese-related sulfurtransferase
VNRSLATVAGVLAVGALLIGDRSEAGPSARQVSALELAAWIKEHKPGLRVIDLRSPGEFDAYHIPTAEPLGPEIAGSASTSTIVVYSDQGSAQDAALAAVHLAPGSGAEIVILRGGVNAWLNDIMLPRLPPDPTPAQRQRYEHQRELSRYFGGRPSALGDDTARASTANAVGKLRRMGC